MKYDISKFFNSIDINNLFDIIAGERRSLLATLI